MRLLFLLLLIPLQLISQNIPEGFVRFSFPTDKLGHPHFPPEGYDLYTSNNFTKENYYGTLEYFWDGGPLLRFRLNINGLSNKSDRLTPSVGNSSTDTIQGQVFKAGATIIADEDCFFAVVKKTGRKIQFVLNREKYLWVKMGNKVNYYNAAAFFTEHCLCAYSDSSMNLYSQPDKSKLVKSDPRFRCFAIKEVKNNWAHIVTTKDDPCANFKENDINDAWIIWYTDKLLIRPYAR